MAPTQRVRTALQTWWLQEHGDEGEARFEIREQVEREVDFYDAALGDETSGNWQVLPVSIG